MTGGATPDERQVLGLPEGVEPTAADAERARRTVVALQRLRSQLLETQGALDEYLGRLDEQADDSHTGDARATTGG